MGLIIGKNTTSIAKDTIHCFMKIVEINKSLASIREGFNYEISGHKETIIELKEWIVRYRYIYSHDDVYFMFKKTKIGGNQ